jgi:hypothetical protein
MGLGIAATAVATNTHSPTATAVSFVSSAAAAEVPAQAKTNSPTLPHQPDPQCTATREEDNPRVEAGLVRWHSSFADAQSAAQRSGKPVLLFHMMGQLDRQFC